MREVSKRLGFHSTTIFHICHEVSIVCGLSLEPTGVSKEKTHRVTKQIK